MSSYSDSFWLLETKSFIRDFLTNFVGKQDLVLDLGCGIGYFSSLIKENLKVRDIVGLDRNIISLEHAHTRMKDMEFVLADASSLPFRENVFDLVLMREVLEHLKEPQKCLKEVHRVSSPNGRLVITTPNGLYMRILHHRHEVAMNHVKEYTLYEVRSLLNKADFSICQTMASNLPFAHRLSKRLPKAIRRILSPFTVSSFYICAKKDRWIMVWL